jgi:hypothetical protein
MKIVQTKMKIAIVSSFSCFIFYIFIEIMGGCISTHYLFYAIRKGRLRWSLASAPLC